MIIENNEYDAIRRLFEENNAGFITKASNEEGIHHPKMETYLLKENEIAKAYAIICFDKHFCELDDYPNQIENMPEKTAYVWEILTNKQYAGKGYASQLFTYVFQKYPDYTFYSCVDETNHASMKLHEKFGFKPIYSFYYEMKPKVFEKEIMMERKITENFQKEGIL